MLTQIVITANKLIDLQEKGGYAGRRQLAFGGWSNRLGGRGAFRKQIPSCRDRAQMHLGR